MMNRTINYYNNNAKNYIEDTKSVNFSVTQDRFLRYLPSSARILDFGCGSGRDTKYFLEKGYTVDAVDGSVEFCKFASEFTGIPVKHMLFQELNEIDKYEGIWACASILHLPKKELLQVLIKMQNALKQNGIMYISFKYGDFEGVRNERYFSDFTEESFQKCIDSISGLILKEQWITSDVRPGRGEEKWLNLILQKS